MGFGLPELLFLLALFLMFALPLGAIVLVILFARRSSKQKDEPAKLP